MSPMRPGPLSRPLVQRVQVSWVGLEDEPASYTLGSTSDSLAADERYPALGVPSEGEFSAWTSAPTGALQSIRPD